MDAVGDILLVFMKQKGGILVSQREERLKVQPLEYNSLYYLLMI